MKKIFAPLTVLGLILLSSCKPSPKQAAEYNDKIIAAITAVQTADDEFAATVDPEGGDQMDAKLKALSAAAAKAESELNGLKKLEDGETFRDAALAFVAFFKQQAAGDYNELVFLAKKQDRTDQETDQANALIEEAGEKRKAAEDKLMAAQEAFAKKYNITLNQKPQ